MLRLTLDNLPLVGLLFVDEIFERDFAQTSDGKLRRESPPVSALPWISLLQRSGFASE
jgi:hypothetical protein